MAEFSYSEILNSFGVSPYDVSAYSPLELAYIGDAVYDLVIRSLVMSAGPAHTDKMHKETSSLVCAHAQAKVLKAIKPHLTDEEADIARRGRNAKSSTMAKNATAGDYRRATGLEALVGYLYLCGQMDRALTLIRTGLHAAGLIPPGTGKDDAVAGGGSDGSKDG